PDRLQLSQAEARLRTAPDRRPDRSGPDHLPAALALEPAWLVGHPRLLAGDPHRPLADLRPAAVPRRRRAGSAPRAPTGGRGVREPARHGPDAHAVRLAA